MALFKPIISLVYLLGLTKLAKIYEEMKIQIHNVASKLCSNDKSKIAYRDIFLCKKIQNLIQPPRI